MFDMKKVGRKIAILRKEKNLTQMELADMLNVSFQAVSNWERGETMPDISKLPEIAQIFNVTIDEILDNQNGTSIIQNIAEGKIEEYTRKGNIAVEDFKAVAPLLKPEQINEVSKGIDVIEGSDDMVNYLPFVSREVADKIALKAIEYGQTKLDEVLPFVSRQCADEIVLKAIETNYAFNSITDIIPFVSREAADRLALKAMENGQTDLEDVMPFVSRQCADTLVLSAVDGKNAFSNLADIIPFVSRETADKVLQKVIENRKLKYKEKE